MNPVAGKALRRKDLGHRKKSDPLRFANPRIPIKSRERNRYTPGSTFLPETARSNILSRFVLVGTG